MAITHEGLGLRPPPSGGAPRGAAPPYASLPPPFFGYSPVTWQNKPPNLFSRFRGIPRVTSHVTSFRLTENAALTGSWKISSQGRGSPHVTANTSSDYFLMAGRGARSRYWCVTTFNYNNDAEHIFASKPPGVRYVVWQEERCPETDRLHVHIYLRFEQPSTMGQVKRLCNDNAAHCEERRGSEAEAVAYVKKPDTRTAGPWEFGVALQEGQGAGARTDVAALAKRVLDGEKPTKIAREDPAAFMKHHRGIQALYAATHSAPYRPHVEVFVLWGETGIGKTWNAFQRWPQLFRVPSHNGDKIWWDGYDGQDTILIDEFTGGMRIDLLLQFLDPYPLSLEVKGSFTPATYTRVIITSNLDPTHWYFNETQAHQAALLRRLTHIVTGTTQQELTDAIEAALNPPQAQI